MLTILGIILILIIAFVALGLIGWGIQALGFIGSFLGEGITGCLGCFVRFFWFIFAAFVLIVLAWSIL